MSATRQTAGLDVEASTCQRLYYHVLITADVADWQRFFLHVVVGQAGDVDRLTPHLLFTSTQ